MPRNAEQNQTPSPNAQNNLPQNSITQTHFAVFDKYFSPIIIKSSENIENEKFQNILKQKSNSTFVTKINQTSQKFLIAKCQIENTENWQIVIFSPIKSVLKGFYKTNISKILSLLVLILFTELAIYFLNKKITKPIIQTSKQLQKAANANITSLECKETFIAESDKIVKSASKIIDKLNISLALEEDFGSSSTLSDLISPLVLKNILNFYTKPQYEGLNLILSKSNGSFLMSSKPISQNFTKTQGENSSTTPIKLENRIIGLIEFQIEENSKITEFIAKQIIENIAGQLSIFVEANYHQSLFYKSQIAKLQRSLINFAKINSKILSQLKPLIFKISNMHSEDFFNYSLLRAEKEKTNILNSLHQIAKQVDNSVEHSVKNELLISLTEKPYTLEELVNSIKKIELAQKPKAKCKISIKTSENLPKTLFGDKNYIIRLVMWTEEMLLKSGNNKIEINIDAIKGTYNFNLKITIQNSLQVFSSQYLEKINAYLNGNFMAFGENENFSNETWRLISIIRIVKMQNGVIKFLQTENNCSKIEIFIPQIETKVF